MSIEDVPLLREELISSLPIAKCHIIDIAKGDNVAMHTPNINNFQRYSMSLNGLNIAVLSTGTIGNNVIEAISKIENSDDFAHYDFGFVKPLNESLLHEIFKKFGTIITIEHVVKMGGFGFAILEFSALHNYASVIKLLGIPDEFIEHGTVNELQQICKIDVESLEILFLGY